MPSGVPTSRNRRPPVPLQVVPVRCSNIHSHRYGLRRSGGAASGHQHGRLARFRGQRGVAVRLEHERETERRHRPTIRARPGDRIHQCRGGRCRHTGHPGLLEQFARRSPERILARAGTPARCHPHTPPVMVDHQHMSAVRVDHPRPHDKLTEIVAADPLEACQSVTFDPCRCIGEQTQPDQIAAAHRFPRADSIRAAGVAVRHGVARSAITLVASSSDGSTGAPASSSSVRSRGSNVLPWDTSR